MILIPIDWPTRVEKGFSSFVMYAFGPRLIWTKVGSQSMTVDAQDVRK